jgi:hypothetical protein
LTRVAPGAHDRAVTDDELLDPREQERARRRDREAEAEQRDLLRPGMNKVFKQIQDAQRRAADELSRPSTPKPPNRRRR